MARPKKIVTAADDKKKFSQPGAIEALRQIAEKQEWSLGFTVWAASEVVKPKMPAEVTKAEIDAATAEILSRGKREKDEKDEKPANDGRLPLNDESQKLWDSGEWRGKLTIHGLRERFKTEIKDRVDLTKSMVDAYAAELAAEKAKVAALVNECDDPDALEKFSCAAPSHRGENDAFALQVRYLLVRNESGALERRKHFQGSGEILAGDLLVIMAGDAVERGIELTSAEIDEGGKRVPFCERCRMAALDEAKEGGYKLTFYTWAGATAKLAAAKAAAAGQEKTSNLLAAAGRRPGHNYSVGSRKLNTDWRQSRGKR